MTGAASDIDPGKLRAVLRTLGPRCLYDMLVDALDALPPGKRRAVVGGCVALDALRPDPGVQATGLQGEVADFERRTRAGEYRNAGAAWVSDWRRLLERCAAEGRRRGSEPLTVREGFDVLFALLARVEDGAEEPVGPGGVEGAWDLGVDWWTVLPSWFKALAATAEVDEYARRVRAMVDRYCELDRGGLLAVARRILKAANRAKAKAVLRRVQGS